MLSAGPERREALPTAQSPTVYATTAPIPITAAQRATANTGASQTKEYHT